MARWWLLIGFVISGNESFIRWDGNHVPTKAHYRIIDDNNKRYGNRGGSHCLFCADIEGTEQMESNADDFVIMELEFRVLLNSLSLSGNRSINIDSQFGIENRE